MKTAKLRVNYGKTFNLGNYESKRIDVSMEIEVDENVWQTEATLLFAHLKNMVDIVLSEES